MKWLIIALIILLAGCAANAPVEGENMKISSPAFEEGGKIPSKFTCDGENVSPQLDISEVPDAKVLVLIMDDPDIPDFVKEKRGIEVFDHWVLFNIAPTSQIAEGTAPGKQGNNSAGNAKYTGPCPPDKEHRYFWKLYALDTELDLPEGSTKAEVEKAMEGHIVEQAQLMGKYERVK